MSRKLFAKYIGFALLIIVIPFNERDENYRLVLWVY